MGFFGKCSYGLLDDDSCFFIVVGGIYKGRFIVDEVFYFFLYGVVFDVVMDVMKYFFIG